jgi:ankyrin repeat protein
MKKYIRHMLLSMLALPSLIAMEDEDLRKAIEASLQEEQPRKHEEKQERNLEQEQIERAIAESMKDFTLSEKSALQELPQELKLLILHNLSSSKGFLQTMKDITKMALVHPDWMPLVSDPTLLKMLVEDHKAKDAKKFYDDFKEAAEIGALPVINAILKFDPNLPKQKLSFALARAIEPKQTSKAILDRLISAGADLDYQSASYNPLAVAVAADKPDIVKYLLEKGSKVNLQLHKGTTAAVGISSVPVLNLLVDAGADLSKGALEGETLLMRAIEKNNRPLMERLIELKAGLNDKDFLGKIALMKAVNLANTEAVRKLLEAGADPNVIADGKTALDIALEENHEEIANMLLEHGAGS